ncbi:D-isomer specific 2-hydroxyacid dehydrogenase, NAD-binding protein [Cereibacter sphaeroides WS8N]|uniref:2-hydroxyacid dehydrogenase n=1 Tax=Cereibacter sphaeroides TaxID=1063 RepID=UPI00020DF7D9|nr:2-hydroxyacid dehydrogenase [Cereibacter sphaeroides]EGJ21878.1 D-isomer specific 2-hydroxyacid dehydrogenase, NAD-binding protein [Cereibacter sphaeroides WS8N]
MDVAIFSAKPYDRQFLAAANEGRHQLAFIEARLSDETVRFAGGADCICAFVNDQVTAPVIAELAAAGTKLIALRSAGFNHVDLAAAEAAGMTVGRVPAYSPHAVAEHAVALILTLNRNTHRAFNRVREGNFALEGLLGFDLCGKTVGVVGTGLIGRTFAGIMRGFGCRVIASDPYPSDECAALGVTYVPLEQLFAEADILSLQCPLTPDTHHLIDDRAIGLMKRGVMIVNTSRGAVVDASAVIRGLKSGVIGGLALDVYEEEADLFFEDLSQKAIQDDVFARLLTFPNVLITGHQAFFTREALSGIARTTIDNITAYEDTGRVLHPVTAPR